MTPRILGALLLMVSGCGDEGGARFPIDPGGGGGGGTTLVDAGVASGDGNTTITGRVCLLGDPRTLTCASAGAQGLTVTLGNQTAMTGGDGSFVIERPADASPLWRVSGDGIESSALPLASSTTIPVVDSLVYADMLAATNAVVLGGNGAIIARIANSGTPVAGITAVATPQADSNVYYDGASIIEWEDDSTGGAGIVWIPSLPAGTASLALDSGAAQATRSNIQVFADTITFVFSTAP